jgi:hypothetical protein
MLSLALALLTGACHGTCLIGGLPSLDGPAGISADDGDLVSDLLPEDELEGEDLLEDVDDFLHGGIADSLLRAGAMAATAGQWFIERHERAISSTSAL